MPARPYRLEFYVDAQGDAPVRRWLDRLSAIEAYMIGSALDGLLQESGPLLCVLRPQYVSALGGGLYEFRLENVSEELLRALGKKPRPEMWATRAEFLFRVFFHPCGEKILLLLAAYDKAKRPSTAHQNEQILTARKRLKEWQQRQRGSTSPRRSASRKRS